MPKRTAAAAWEAQPAPRARMTRTFVIGLAIILAVAAGVRIAYVLGVADSFNQDKFYDAAFYELGARQLADGNGFIDPFLMLPGASHERRPAADHPPLAIVVLAPVSKVTHSQLALRFESALAGLLTVALIGLLGREVAGDATGLTAAGLAALYPNLWVNDGLIMSESFTGVAVVGALLLAYRAGREGRGRGWWIAAGAVCGVAALGRAELLLLAPLLAAGVLVRQRSRGWGHAAGNACAVLVAMLVVVTPWIAYNLSRFDRPTLISTNDGIAMLASNCDSVYHGSALGLTDLRGCIPARAPAGDQSVVSERYRRDALHYMREHEDRVPVVLAARIGRNWSLYRPLDMLDWNLQEGRPRWITGLGLWWYYPLVVAAIGGAVVLWRRREWLWPLLVPVVIVTVSPVLSYGQTRFRFPAEPSLVTLAAVGLVALVGVVARRSPARTAEPG